MSSGHLKLSGALVAISALGLAGYASVGASADTAARGNKAATITMVSDGHNLLFQGDKTVKVGSKLQIVNATDPKKVGPHTFSLVKKRELPTSNSAMKACEQGKGVCGDIITALQPNPQTGEVGQPIVDVGQQGWDKSFGKTGDTWFTEKEGGINSREVTSKPRTLHYLCIIHPFMQGKIKVVK